MYEYMIEKQLMQLEPQLHRQYKNCMVVSHQMLLQYQSRFPEYTDHSNLHTLEIIDACNALIADQIPRLSAADLYVLLMGALFHDVGMGISEKDFYAFMQGRMPQLVQPLPPDALQEQIRKNHHEISGWFLNKYWELFDIPNEAYAKAIIQVCRGHRKVDLYDPNEYPLSFAVDEDRSVVLPYLAALLRLADELDMEASRNPSFLYDPKAIKNDVSRLEFLKHQSIQSVEILPDRILVIAAAEDASVREAVIQCVEKLAQILYECRSMVAQRTPFVIRQEIVELSINGKQLLF